MSNQKSEDLWDDIPGGFYIALGRRGQELITADQCFLPGCDNHDPKMLEPQSKTVEILDKKDDGGYTECKKVTMLCKKCNQKFIYALKTIYAPREKESGESEIKSFMGIAYIFSEDGKNLGQVGYF